GILQSVLDQMQDRFMSLVRERRPALSADTARTISDGRILTADQALQAGLVDRIGYLDETLALARQRAGVTAARVIVYRRPDEYAENVYSQTATAPAQLNLFNIDLGGLGRGGPQFLYMWWPSAE